MPRLAFVVLIVLTVVVLAAYRPQSGQAGSPGCQITVDSTLDEVASDTEVTLREAILFSMNVIDPVAGEIDEVQGADCTPSNPGPNIDDIVFDGAVFPDGGSTTIDLAGPLPPLNQHGGGIYGNGGVIVEGDVVSNCLTITSNFHFITGLQFSRCSVGVTIDGSAGPAQNNSVGLANFDRNYFYDNNRGIVITGSSATNNTVENNYIGTMVAGDVASPNQIGVRVTSGAHGNRVGGTDPNSRNVISGNVDVGVLLDEGSTTTEVMGNYIGLDATGSAPVPNNLGIGIGDSTGNAIGSPAGRNVISGNTNGIQLTGAGTFSNVIQGNYIGTDASGTNPVGNASVGIFLLTSPNNNVGGMGVGEGNLISGNTSGIVLNNPGTTHNTIFGNAIGLGSDGNPIGNTQWGIFMSGAGGNNIGGGEAGQGNTIAYNGKDGIGIVGGPPSSHGNAILGNSIHDNGKLGIDLQTDGVTENDADDSDDGANALQNFPELDLAELAAGQLHVVGGLTSAPLTNYHIEFFANHDCDPTGNGEGDQIFGSIERISDASGTVIFDVVLPTSAVFGDLVTATATDPDGNTSEFSACHPVTTAGVLWGNNDCVNGIDAADALLALKAGAGLAGGLGLRESPSCSIVGQTHLVNGAEQIWGGVLCQNQLTPTDALAVLAYIGEVSQPQPGAVGCPEIGSTVAVGSRVAPIP